MPFRYNNTNMMLLLLNFALCLLKLVPRTTTTAQIHEQNNRKPAPEDPPREKEQLCVPTLSLTRTALIDPLINDSPIYGIIDP